MSQQEGPGPQTEVRDALLLSKHSTNTYQYVESAYNFLALFHICFPGMAIIRPQAEDTTYPQNKQFCRVKMVFST